MSYGSVIAAISTPSGKGGVALIRVSGEGAVEICEKVFKPKSRITLTDIPPRTQIYGDILKGGEVIDDGMATVFRAPASYTGEDTVEICCHGGTLITQRVLEAVLLAGAVPAERGEFTERAFINGKLSLTDAEAIGNLLEAKNDGQIKLASSTSRGRLTDSISELRGELSTLLASIFARIDYPDEDLGEFTNEESRERLTVIDEKISKLISTYSTAKAVNEGISTVICGKTNAGKSSVYNAILGTDAAIVTDIEGTTRDVLSSEITLGRVLLRLSDTAGIRSLNRADTVEKIGIERSISAIERSELIIAVFDASRDIDDDDKAILSHIEGSDAVKIALMNKCDLEKRIDESLLSGFSSVIKISAKEKPEEVREKLTDALTKLFLDEKLTLGEDAIVSSARQNAALISALEYIKAAISALSEGQFIDAAASEIELALGKIAELDGRAVADEVLSEIFSKFCVGK
ncbi:MAG: tRNA uridine-5-carboxymethylaminomethyl(34) synthesis GTPase MnmE [Clostridia bacterium]|nr:tRNA uridine-5-carboxymethylaminomethyl(34) synthesis GTPase MnmE [Clostridia bacterium]